jgi:hypothetical protein
VLAAPGTDLTTLTVSDGVGSFSTSLTIIVTKEDATATYTGALFASTAAATSSTATVTLSATIKDITAEPTNPLWDGDLGDIRNAKVSFVLRNDPNPPTSISGCTNLAVGLVNSADSKVGTATCNWNATINPPSQSFTIGIVVNNYFTRDASVDDTVITVSQPLSNFITGGGYLQMTSPTTSSAGFAAAAAGTKNNFGFNVKYNKQGTNLQGNINTIIRSTLIASPSGCQAPGLHVYQIKGNAMTSLSVDPITGKAVFNGKANIQDITDGANVCAVDGNATLQVTMDDNGEPGSADTISITVWNKAGGLWFASKWNGTMTVEQLLGGGNLLVH